MVSKSLLELLKCPACDGISLRIGSGRRPEIICDGCDAHYPVVDGIPDLIPHNRTVQPGQYRSETLHNVIAGVYDVTVPVMSFAVWQCSPLRYVDVEHRAIGRANGGVYLKAPMSTGLILDKVLAPYHDVTIVGVDPSWKMLQKARRRLASHRQPIHLVRADLDRLPLRDGVVDSVQSLNGLHAFTDRRAVLGDFRRVARAGGYIAGTGLVRGQNLIADGVLDRYERYGVYPLLRTAEFLVEEMKSAGLQDVRFETHGAILFYSGHALEA